MKIAHTPGTFQSGAPGFVGAGDAWIVPRGRSFRSLSHPALEEFGHAKVVALELLCEEPVAVGHR